MATNLVRGVRPTPKPPVNQSAVEAAAVQCEPRFPLDAAQVRDICERLGGQCMPSSNGEVVFTVAGLTLCVGISPYVTAKRTTQSVRMGTSIYKGAKLEDLVLFARNWERLDADNRGALEALARYSAQDHAASEADRQKADAIRAAQQAEAQRRAADVQAAQAPLLAAIESLQAKFEALAAGGKPG